MVSDFEERLEEDALKRNTAKRSTSTHLELISDKSGDRDAGKVS